MMKIHQYLIDDRATGDKYLVAHVSQLEAKVLLANKLLDINNQVWNEEEVAAMSSSLNTDIQYGNFYSLTETEINNQLFDLEVTHFETEVEMSPTIVCLCGSTRFSEAFQQANLDETLAGNIVLTTGCDMRSDAQVFADKTESELADIKANLDELHLRKIDMADEVLILNVDGYVGESTRREWQYAKEQGKVIRWLESDKIPGADYRK